MTVGSADRQKPTQKLYELLAQKNHRVNSLVCYGFNMFLLYINILKMP